MPTFGEELHLKVRWGLSPRRAYESRSARSGTPMQMLNFHSAAKSVGHLLQVAQAFSDCGASRATQPLPEDSATCTFTDRSAQCVVL